MKYNDQKHKKTHYNNKTQIFSSSNTVRKTENYADKQLNNHTMPHKTQKIYKQNTFTYTNKCKKKQIDIYTDIQQKTQVYIPKMRKQKQR